MTTTLCSDALAADVPPPIAGGSEPPAPPMETALAAVEGPLILQPQTPFVALHAAIGLAGTGNLARLSAPAAHCRRARDGTLRTVVASVCDALVAVGEARWADAAALLCDVLPVLKRVGGSAAQREVVEETLRLCLISAGELERATAVLDERLDRRPSPLDARRRASLCPSRAGLERRVPVVAS
jgi:hypothetical protein